MFAALMVETTVCSVYTYICEKVYCNIIPTLWSLNISVWKFYQYVRNWVVP